MTPFLGCATSRGDLKSTRRPPFRGRIPWCGGSPRTDHRHGARHRRVPRCGEGSRGTASWRPRAASPRPMFRRSRGSSAAPGSQRGRGGRGGVRVLSRGPLGRRSDGARGRGAPGLRDRRV